MDASGFVDYKDLYLLINYWLEDPAGSVPYAGVNGDNIVDLVDYALLANDWMLPANPNYKGSTSGTSFQPALEKNVTYYWRIDTVEAGQRRTGDLWSFTVPNWDANSTLVGKVMAGYQAWFNAPGDGTSRGWVHWGNGTFAYGSANIDWWPDMTEYGADEKFLASGFYDGTNHYVFSSHNLNTVKRHFKWMQDYGIDGVWLQRFITECNPADPALL